MSHKSLSYRPFFLFRHFNALRLVLLSLVVMLGCGGEDAPVDSGGGTAEATEGESGSNSGASNSDGTQPSGGQCVVGDSQPCTCPDGAAGFAACLASDGTYAACVCDMPPEAMPDAGTSTDGGTSGVSPGPGGNPDTDGGVPPFPMGDGGLPPLPMGTPCPDGLTCINPPMAPPFIKFCSENGMTVPDCGPDRSCFEGGTCTDVDGMDAPKCLQFCE